MNPVSISVVLPVHNARDTLLQALESVLRSSGDMEIMIVDDGSDDGSGGIADMVANRDHRVRVLHIRHGG